MGENDTARGDRADNRWARRATRALIALVFSSAAAAAQEPLCESPNASCKNAVPAACLGAIGAGAIALEPDGVSCNARMAGYRDCLILVVQQCQSAASPKQDAATPSRVQQGGADEKAAASSCPLEIETRLWDAVKDSGDATLVRHFLDSCADSALAPIARARLAALEAEQEAAAVVADCPQNFEGRAGLLTCRCPAGAAGGSVWGSGPYTADSAICKAARHAGVVGPEGGAVTLAAAPGQPAYQGSSRNGVATSRWDAYGASFVFPDAPEASASGPAQCPQSFSGLSVALDCFCAPEAMRGSVWGSDVYTADSAICRAALHAGAATASGGVVSLQPEAGRAAYQGTLRNGVSTANWGSYGASFSFKGAGAAAADAGEAVCPVNATHLRGQAVALSCRCPAGAFAGSVWGDGIYTDDSSICRAALHAGAIGAEGGPVTFETLAGQSAYAGASRNGVSTAAYGAWHGSFRFTGG